MALAYKLNHKEDPKEAIWRQLREAGVNLDEVDIAAQGVLIATYMRPDDVKTTGNILLPHQVVREDEFQSRVGMVIKLGRRAFVDDEHVEWHGYRCDPGDWVVFRLSEGMKMQLGGAGGVQCRMLSDVTLKMKIPHPDAVY